MRRFFASILVVLVAFAAASHAGAHEVRPAYLEVSQTAPDAYTALWKQPILGEFAVHLVPHLSNGWLEGEPADQYVSNGFLIRTWELRPGGAAAGVAPSPRSPLEGLVVTIEGLEQTITDVFVRVRLLDGHSFEGLVHPQSPRLTIELRSDGSRALPTFLVLGVEHILSGPDHLLFVLGL